MAKPELTIQLDGLNESIEVHVKEAIRAAMQDVTTNPIERKEYLNKSEAAKYLSVSYSTLQKMIIDGLPICYLGSKVLIRRIAIDEYMKAIEQ